MTGRYRYLLRVRGQDFAVRLDVESREEVEKRLSEDPIAEVLPKRYFLEYFDEEEDCYVRVLRTDELPEGGNLRVSPLNSFDMSPPPYSPPLDVRSSRFAPLVLHISTFLSTLLLSI